MPGELKYHFMGIGGVAMGNLAAAMKRAGFRVSGSDMGVYSPMKEYLAESGIVPLTPYSPDNLAGADLVIVGNAITRGNPELEAMLRRRMTYTSLAEFLRWGLLTGRKNLVITGTHGKTTSAALTAHILRAGGMEPGWMVGGVPNDLPGGFNAGEGEYFVIEGDEYDIAYFDKRAKFLQYLPFGVIINCIEYDHGDIYPDLASIQDAFGKMARQIPENGVLALNGDDPNLPAALGEARCPVLTFGRGDNCRYRVEGGSGRIVLFKDYIKWGESAFTPPGQYNLMNAAGAVCLLDALGVDKGVILEGLASFRGVRRRMELVSEPDAPVTIIDDFAHHPTAVKGAIAAVRETYPGRRLWAVFQPRSNTSVTNIFQAEWVDAFSGADIAVVAELHRKDKIPESKRLSREQLKYDLKREGVENYLWQDADEILNAIGELLRPGDVVLVMSNSDFEGLVIRLKERLT